MKRLMNLAIWAFACSVGLAQAGELTLSTTGYTGSFLTDFPVLVRLSEAKLTGFKYAEAAPENIRFLSPDGQTEYPREIEHWNPEGESLIWVKLPLLSPRTSFKFVWGGESTTTVPSDVWARSGNSYVGVWHMDEENGDVADATGHGLTAEPYANATTKGYDKSVAGEGPVGNSRRISEEYKQTGPRLRVAYKDNLRLGGCFTVSCWVKSAVGSVPYARLLSNKPSNSSPGWEIHGNNNATLSELRFRANGSEVISVTGLPSVYENWHYLTFVYDRTCLSAYADGNFVTSGTVPEAGVVEDVENPLAIGAGGNNEWSLNGWMDEVRLLQGAANPVWIKACYDTQTNPDFVTVGAPPPLPEDTIVFDDPAQPTKTLTAATAASGVVSAIPAATIEVSPATTYHYGHHGLALLSPNGTDAAEIDLSAGGTLTIDADLTDLEFDTSEACVSGDWADGVTAATLLLASPTTTTEGEAITYWKNRLLSDIKAFRATVVDDDGTQAFVARSLYFTNDNATASVQFSFRRDATWLMIAKVEFRQVGDDITARVCWIRGVQNAPDEAISGEDYAGNKSTPQAVYDGQTSQTGIGIRAIEAGELGTRGGKGVTVNPAYEYAVDPEEFLPAGNTATRYWKNLRLTDIEAVAAKVDRWDKFSVLGTTVSRSSTEWTIDFAGQSWGQLAAARVKLTQRGSDVYAQVTKSSYSNKPDDSATIASEFWKCILPAAADAKGTVNDGNTRIAKLCPILKETSLAFGGQLNLAGSLTLGGQSVTIGSPAVVDGLFPLAGYGTVRYKEMSDVAGTPGIRWTRNLTNTCAGVTIFDGTRFTPTKPQFMPPSSIFVLTNGAFASVGDIESTLGSPYTLYATGGSCLEFGKRGGSNARVCLLFIDGSTLHFNQMKKLPYAGYISLKNGSHVTAEGTQDIAFGYWLTPPLVVSDADDGGATTNVFSAPFRLGDNEGLLFVCRTSDLRIEGNITASTTDAKKKDFFRKVGDCKLILANPDNTSTNYVKLLHGPLRIENPNALKAKNGVMMFENTTLEIAAGVAANFGRLTVTKEATTDTTSTVVLEPGASLAVSEEGFSLGEGTSLRIKGSRPDETPVRIGTRKCLTDEQLASIRWVRPDGSSHRVQQNDSGYLCQPGLVLIVR